MARLPLDNPACPIQLRPAIVVAQNLHRAANRCERIAQLVTQHREKLILTPVHLAQRVLDGPVGPGLLERRPHDVRDSLHQLDFGETPVPGDCLDDRQHGHERPALQEGRRHEGTDSIQSEPAVTQRGDLPFGAYVADRCNQSLASPHRQLSEWPQRQARDLDLRPIRVAIAQHDGLACRLVEFDESHQWSIQTLSQAEHGCAHQLLGISHERQFGRQCQQECRPVVGLAHLMNVR